jgi:hypothetical protein
MPCRTVEDLLVGSSSIPESGLHYSAASLKVSIPVVPKLVTVKAIADMKVRVLFSDTKRPYYSYDTASFFN